MQPLKRRILTDTTIRTNPEDVMLSEIGQQQKDKSCLTPFTGGIWSRQIHRNRKANAGCQGLEGEQNGGLSV